MAGEIYAALSKAQAKFPTIPRSKEVLVKSDKGSYKFKYAPLESILEAVRPALAENGLAIFHRIETGERNALVAVLAHAGGETIESRMPLSLAGRMQEQGSELTYKKRYTLQSVLGVSSDDDDDGNAADGNHVETLKNGSRLKAEANRIAEEIEACGDREQLQAYMATNEVKDFLKRAEEDAKRHSGINLADLTNQRFHDRNDKLPERKAPGKVEQILPEYTKMVDDFFALIDSASTPDALKEASKELRAAAGKLDPKDKNDLNRAYEAKARTLSPKAAA